MKESWGKKVEAKLTEANEFISKCTIEWAVCTGKHGIDEWSRDKEWWNSRNERSNHKITTENQENFSKEQDIEIQIAHENQNI